MSFSYALDSGRLNAMYEAYLTVAIESDRPVRMRSRPRHIAQNADSRPRVERASMDGRRRSRDDVDYDGLVGARERSARSALGIASVGARTPVNPPVVYCG